MSCWMSCGKSCGKASHRSRPRGWRWLALAAFPVLAACGPRQSPGRDLPPVPALDLTAAEAGAREQLEGERQALVMLLADRKATAPEVAEAFGDLGLLYITYEFLDAAQVCFSNASKIAPEDYRWPYLGAYLHKVRGRLPQAVEGFEEALRGSPEFLPARLRLGQIRAEQGEATLAREQFEKALELEPDCAPAYQGLGELAAAAGDDRAAVEAYSQALDLDPRATALHYLLGLSYRNLGDLEKAQLHLAQRGEVATRIPDPLLNPLASRAASSQFYLVQGAEALEAGDFSGAAAAYRQALEKAPQTPAAFRGLSTALLALGDAGGALQALEEGVAVCLDLEGTPPLEKVQLLVLLADRLEALGRSEEALPHLLRTLELAPEQPLLRLRLANALARRGRLEEAVELYSQLLEAGAQSVSSGGGSRSRVLEKRATAYVNLGRREEARADFQQALREAPEDGRLRLRYAEALDFLGDPEGAREQRRQASAQLKNSPQRFGLMVDSARELAASGDLVGAEAKLREVLAQAPDFREARLGLATVLGNGGQYGGAAEEFRQVLGEAPGHVAARRGLVEALILGGDFLGARVELAEAVRRRPRDLELALIQVRLLASAPDPRVRDGSLAREIALRIVEDHRTPETLLALALAHAEAGGFSESLAIVAELLESAEGGGDAVRRAGLEARQRSFEVRSPWTAASGEELLGL